MPKMKFIGEKFREENKGLCNKHLALVMKLERFFVDKTKYEIFAYCKDYKIVSIKLIAVDQEVLNALQKIFMKHDDIIVPVHLRHPREFFDVLVE